MIRRTIAVVLLLALAGGLLVAAWPQTFGLETAPIVAQVVALRGIDIAIAVAAAVVFALVALAWRAIRPFLLGAVALLVVFSLASVGILAARGFDGGTPTDATGDVTVLSWNTKGDAPGPEAIARLALAEHADVIALPETTLELGTQISLMMKAQGEPMWVYSTAFNHIAKSKSTTLLISAALGKYTVDSTVADTSILPTVVARPDDGDGPTIIAVHAVSPKPYYMRHWRSDLKLLSGLCSGENTIMAGDFNATLDHLRSLRGEPSTDFGACTDAGGASHGAAVGSWPTNLPPLAGAQIDHVFYTNAWKVVDQKVITTEDSAGSDHRPVVATLARS